MALEELPYLYYYSFLRNEYPAMSKTTIKKGFIGVNRYISEVFLTSIYPEAKRQRILLIVDESAEVLEVLEIRI